MPSRRHVRETYDRIAGHFSKTRRHPWSEVESFLEGREGEIGLDVGCGNGRHTELLADRTERTLGFDLSRACLREAADRASGTFEADFLQGDASSLPFRRDLASLAVYVAALHHLGSRDRRLRSLDELARVLAPGGAAIVSVWSVSHDRFDRTEGFDTTVDWVLPDGEAVPRFYHVYDREEFRTDLERSDLVVEDVFESHGNCWGVVKG